MTFSVNVCPATHDVTTLPGGWENCAVAVKSFAVQPKLLPARVPIQDWSVSAVMLAVCAIATPEKPRKSKSKQNCRAQKDIKITISKHTNYKFLSRNGTFSRNRQNLTGTNLQPQVAQLYVRRLFTAGDANAGKWQDMGKLGGRTT